jgi:hypothetical protein
VRSDAETVDEYLESLPADPDAQIAQVRRVILANLPDGYVETTNWGMISYEIPLETYPDTYNGKPLMYAALASQKNHMAVYLSGIYGIEGAEPVFKARYLETGKKLDLGKSCVRFKTIDDLPFDLIGETIAALPPDDFIAGFEKGRG